MARKRDLLRAFSPEHHARLLAEAGPPADHDDPSAAIARWKALPLGAHALCARGRVWRVTATGRRPAYREQYSDGTEAPREVSQPWYPLICAGVSLWPVRIEWPPIAAED